MNKQYTNSGKKYHNNHCTESAVEFIPHVVEAQCVNDCDDGEQSEYDTLDEWTGAMIDMLEADDFITYGELGV